MTVELVDVWTPGLVLVRITGLVLVAPVFGHLLVPMRVRAGLAIVLTLGLSPWVTPVPAPEGDAFSLVAAIGGEAIIGTTLGFAAGLVFSGFAIMGEFASVQGGLGAATVLDPASGASSVVLASILQLTALAIFIAIDGHYLLLGALMDSFTVLPPGGGGLSVTVFEQITGMGALIFEVGVKLAFPVTAAMLVSNVAVGMLGRAIPQLNLMALQLPAHVGVTLLILGLGAGPLVDAMRAAIEHATQQAIAITLGAA